MEAKVEQEISNQNAAPNLLESNTTNGRPLESSKQTTLPIQTVKKAENVLKSENHNYASKTIVSNKDSKESQLIRCKSDVKNEGPIEISQLKLGTQVENRLAVNKAVQNNDKNEELFVHQSSYLGEVVSMTKPEVVNQLLSLKQNSIALSPDQPIVEEKKSSPEKEKQKEASTQKLPSLVEKDHALNEKSKKKFNPEIFIQLKTGTILTHYKIGQVLGEGSLFIEYYHLFLFKLGAYGKVNLVTHKTTNIVRALKTIKKDAIPKEDEKKLLSEMNILKTLDHPGIIKLIELYQDDKHYYLITEYVFNKF